MVQTNQDIPAPAPITLNPGHVSLGELRAIWSGASASLAPQAYAVVERSVDSITRILGSGQTVYGVNTGFGLLAQTRIPSQDLATLQRNLVLSHACGIGPALDPHITRLILALKIIGLARGASGIRREVIDRLLTFLDRDILPVIPCQGSVGASGDLAPLAHLSAPLIGAGHLTLEGRAMPAQDGLKAAGLAPLELGPKEGLALLNGTQVSTAIALDALFTAERVYGSALAAGALSTDALKGSDTPFDPRIHALRGQPGQIAAAAILRQLLEQSEIRDSHTTCEKVQDPYSFRCQPQVMGACLDLLRNAAHTLTIEANAVSDNPVIDPDTDEALSGGNFHAEPVAFAADSITMAACEIGSLSERRISVLTDPKMSGLPPFLVRDSGLNSGFMIPQVTAAALVSENKSFAFPASVDSIPTSAGQEDHVSMATGAARKAGQVARNAGAVVGIELLAAAQGADFHAPLKTSPVLCDVLARIRAKVPHMTQDDYWAEHLENAKYMVLEGQISSAVASILPSDLLEQGR